MTPDLQAENHALRCQLEGLLQEARLNESKMRRFDQLERQLVGAGSLVELFGLLLTEYKLAFGVDFVSLALVDAEHEAARIYERAAVQGTGFDGLMLLDSADALADEARQQDSPWLGPFDAERHEALFVAPPGAIASVAMIPLARHGKWIGCLHLGSADPRRYTAGCATDFLMRLSSIIAICLVNAMAQEQSKAAGLTDGLTGVQNRRYFDHRYPIEVTQALRRKQTLACVFIDIDKFKRINDTHGHQVGDEVLRSVAGIIQAQLRTADTIARFGGEEFVVLLPQTTGHHAQKIAERIRLAVSASPCCTAGGHVVPVTISLGLSASSHCAQRADVSALAEEMLARADKALYRAKESGRNRVVSDADDANRRPGDFLVEGTRRLAASLFDQAIWRLRVVPRLLRRMRGAQG